MPTQQKKREIGDLIKHLKQYKDAVLILGEDIAPELNVKSISDEEGESIFNRKSLVKDKEKFWEYYFENIYLNNSEIEKPKIYKKIDELLELDLIKKVYSINTHGLCDAATNLSGVANKVKCSKCGKEHDISSDEDLHKLAATISTLECSKCGAKKLRPTCLMCGENYLHEEMKDLLSSIFLDNTEDESIPNTHTVIYLGVDMMEDLIGEIFDNYLLLRERVEEECFNVMISNSVNTVNLFKPEFCTSEDIDGSLERLINLLK